MYAKRLAGPGAGVRKYDLLTALAVAGLAGSPGFSMSMTRLIALITARYNWRLDEVSIGQADLARMWSVDVRTVKREIKRLVDHGVVVIKRPGARGRVATYVLNHGRIHDLTRDVWDLVGTDFQDRMGGQGTPSLDGPAGMGTTVVPLHPNIAQSHHGNADQGSSEWADARAALRLADRARAQAWYDPLIRAGRDGDMLVLRAPSDFHAGYVSTHMMGDLVRAVGEADPTIVSVRIIA